ncbi:LRR and NB-ARC domains-containing disease resistance protein [Dorcoceras hygrometricum]|uniref:LRR and NB-ARC domains-containing disease resistance protein n=1 Tax=Dorcoceras hygrometricum TaxID=472368 RepID=A0A2Z7DCU0_9LAMI|nr:LRR and NB-ARC domains-containing disease resistance protein [Dorcoceras hygrometricum]
MSLGKTDVARGHRSIGRRASRDCSSRGTTPLDLEGHQFARSSISSIKDRAWQGQADKNEEQVEEEEQELFWAGEDFVLEMDPSVPRTRVAAALRMKKISLDNQSRTRCNNHSLRNTVTLCHKDIDRRISQLIEAKKEHKTDQVALEASHKTIAGLTEIGLCMSKKIERIKAKKQQARDSHMECHHKLQAHIQEAEHTIQEQHLIIEALVEEKLAYSKQSKVCRKTTVLLLHSMMNGRKNRRKTREKKGLRNSYRRRRDC